MLTISTLRICGCSVNSPLAFIQTMLMLQSQRLCLGITMKPQGGFRQSRSLRSGTILFLSLMIPIHFPIVIPKVSSLRIFKNSLRESPVRYGLLLEEWEGDTYLLFETLQVGR